MTTLAERFAILANMRPDITKGDLAKACRVKPPSVSDWFSGETKSLKFESAVEAAALYGVSPRWLAKEEGEMILTADSFEQANASSQQDAEIIRADRTNVDPAPALRPFKDVPVVGTVQGGDKGYLLELEHAVGHGDGHITYPARDHQSYAVRVRGDSMRPRIKAGEFIVCEPNHECQPGDDVVVITKDGRRMVKELLYIRDGEATLGSINNGHGNITIPLADIEKMHYVAAIIPRGAFYKSE